MCVLARIEGILYLRYFEGLDSFADIFDNRML